MSQFTEKELVAFGNYLLSPERKQNLVHESNANTVTDADLANFCENRKSFGMSFGQAVDAAKKGHKIAREGWNGADMYAYIVPAASYPAKTDIAKAEFGESVPYREYWALKTAQNDVATWAPSGSDSLAEDWIIVN